MRRMSWCKGLMVGLIHPTALQICPDRSALRKLKMPIRSSREVVDRGRQ